MLDTVKEQDKPTHTGRPVTIEVITDLAKRREGGVVKYGGELTTNNGRNPLIDLYQELLDATCYVRQAIMEQADAPIFTTQELGILHHAVHRWMAQRQGLSLTAHLVVSDEVLNELDSKLRGLVAGAASRPAQSR